MTEYTPGQIQRQKYREWEARLGLLLADANKHLPTDDYVRLCDWLIDVCDAELQMIRQPERREDR